MVGHPPVMLSPPSRRRERCLKISFKTQNYLLKHKNIFENTELFKQSSYLLGSTPYSWRKICLRVGKYSRI